MDAMEAYTIKIDAFEGPFDLLFHLIEKNKFDIYDIPISLIADQYLDYVVSMQKMDLDVAGDFLVMASTLMHIKSRLLLPAPGGGDGDEEDADPRDELVVSILEYRKYKEFSASLRDKAAYWGGAKYREADLYGPGGESGVSFPEQQTLFDMDRGRLLMVYRNLVDARRRRHENVEAKVGKIVERDHVTLANKIKDILDYLTRKPRFLFQKLYNPATMPKLDIIVGFNALLELSQQSRVALRQRKLFGGLFVSRRERKAK
ncbi:MAG: segregation/condensation protein A [Oscillospiraceae bacterium]|nr:segregation/condensation protein A [Oscillospiraceae bacterium]